MMEDCLIKLTTRPESQLRDEQGKVDFWASAQERCSGRGLLKTVVANPACIWDI